MEVERKFLVSDVPDLTRAEAVEIEQGYLALATQTDGVEVRLRRVADACELTVKGGTGLARAEESVEIGAERFAALWPLTEGRRVSKRRHLLPLDGLTVELDLFRGEHEGLVLAEVEFANESEAASFEPPAWLGVEVTGDPRLLNETLATATAPDVEQLVRRS